ncbi:hypothetical protein ABPG75_013773 [Micractinium tetrahymenae]
MQQQRIGLRPGLGSRPAALPHRQPGTRPQLFRLGTAPQATERLGRRNALVLAAAGQQDAGGAGGTSAAVGLFPAGKRQARVQLPALFLSVTAAEALDDAGAEAVSAAVAGGATAVVLQQGDSAGELYAAAVRLKELLRGRAALLIADRTDIVEAAGADGALLTAAGLPTVVAKRNLRDGLALVGRAVGAAEEAAEAAADGANFVVLAHPAGGAAPTGAEVAAARTQQRSSASIPVLAAAAAGAGSGELAALLQAGVDGLMLRPSDLAPVAGALSSLQPTNAADAAAALLQLLGSAATGDAAAAEAAPAAPAAPQQQAAAEAAGQQQAVQLSQLLSSSREELVDAERVFFTEVVGFLERWCPALEEAQLLRDSIKQLDELFLLVVLGEFNSGKSAVVNALLGQRYLAEGILPTTNEINVLKHLDPEHGESAAQDGDGVFTRYLPAELLKEVNVVDTPGTNVILGRQQRLTEEYVPRADLVLFVLSADRPLTESEVKFLQYVRQWGKKVVFVVNKIDILSSPTEVAEVVSFVRSNASRVLGVDDPQVLPVSARAAMEAKLAILGDSSEGNGQLSAAQAAELAANPAWQRSGFESLERFIFEFLTGGAQGGAGANGSSGGRAGAESVRLKLESPLFVADALLSAAEQQLSQELAVARQDAATVSLVRSQLAAFRREMEKEGQLQREEVARQVAATTKKAAAVVDSMLQLSNVEVITSYLFGSKDGARALPVAKALEDLAGDANAGIKSLVKEHSAWLSSNCQRQLSNYRVFAEQRAAALGQTLEGVLNTELEGLDSDAEARRRWREMRQLTTEAEVAAAAGGTPPDAEAALVAVAALDPKTTEVMLEEEVREAVISTAGTAAGAGAFGVLLTAVLPTTVEDLLALSLAAMVGYVSILNLPMRRAEAKRKLETLTNTFAEDIQSKMEAELRHSLAVCEAEVLSFIAPLEQLTAAEVRRLEAAEAGRGRLVEHLDRLKQRVANVE